jgi:hypothetical protein
LATLKPLATANSSTKPRGISPCATAAPTLLGEASEIDAVFMATKPVSNQNWIEW